MKNKINNYDFLIVGAGLIGSLAALHLFKKKYKVLVIDKNNAPTNDDRTLAVNANSKEFLNILGIWGKIKSSPEQIDKIIIKDFVNSSPLVFQDTNEEMGNVIFNKDLHSEAIKELKKNRLLIQNIDIPIKDIGRNKKIIIRGRNYSFSNVILSLGKRYENEKIIKKVVFSNSHKSFVGFFEHSVKHRQIAYEIFTPNGPLAVLPSPHKSKKKSTFIFSSKTKNSKINFEHLIKKYFNKSHGFIRVEKIVNVFEISPHLSLEKNNNFILIGDTLRSIHPVAGQGWNLGVKDIQCLSYFLDIYGAKNNNLIKKYYENRIIENISYLAFTSTLNKLYENQNPINNLFIKIGFKTLKNFNVLKSLFIKQAMGRLNLI